MDDSGQIVHSNNLDINLEINKGVVKEPVSNASHQIQAQIAIILELITQRDFDGARKKLKKLLTKNQNSPAVWNIKGILEVETKKYDDALESFKKVTELDSKAQSGYLNLVRLLLDTGMIDDALIYLKISLQKFPKNYELHYLYGRLLYKKDDFQASIDSCKEALQLKPDFPEALLTLGNGLRQLNNLEHAKKCYEICCQLNSNSAEALNNLGACYKLEEDFETALNYFKQAVKINPRMSQLHNNMGGVYEKLGNIDSAIECFEIALSINPDLKEANLNISSLFVQINEHQKAFDYLSNILRKYPNDLNALNNMAVLMSNIRKPQQALKYYEQLLVTSGFYASDTAHQSLRNMGNAYKELGQLDKALACFEEAIQLNENFSDGLISAMAIRHIFCDWSDEPELKRRESLLGIEGEPIGPFTMLRHEDDAEKQLIRSTNWAKNIFPSVGKERQISTHKQANGKIKVGYFGSDFFDHATLFLMLGLLRNHDRDRFEIYIFSYGHDNGGAYRHEVKKHCNEFYDIQSSSDEAVVKLVHDVCLDIAIDLKGYTKNTRSALFAHNLAPVQINYLGYPSTMGANCIQYIIADQTIIPQHYTKFYSENIIWMPDSYQPNDNNRKISSKKYKRSDFDLPEGKIILCCHNQLYKVSSAEFDIWMRILSKNRSTILWLLGGNKNAEQNILKEASKRGVECDRIIFCDAIEPAEHLARLKLADVFLDTFFVNAHTTASDALWAGVPVVTKIGEQFAARVGASLLHAIGLDELVVETSEEYESLISDIILNPIRLRNLKERLHENVKRKPLFDTKGYTKYFEKALLEVHEIALSGDDPRNIIVS